MWLSDRLGRPVTHKGHAVMIAIASVGSLLVAIAIPSGWEPNYFPSNNASTESPVFSTRLGLSTGLNEGLWVRNEPFGR